MTGRAITLSHEIECGVALGDCVWVNAFELARGRARGTVSEVTPHDFEHWEGPIRFTLRIYTVKVRLDRPAHVPRYAYTHYDSVRGDYKRLTDWPGALDVEVPSHALDKSTAPVQRGCTLLLTTNAPHATVGMSRGEKTMFKIVDTRTGATVRTVSNPDMAGRVLEALRARGRVADRAALQLRAA